MQIFDAIATAAGLPFERLIPALQRRFSLGCTVPARHVHTLGAGRAAPVTSLLMPAWVEGGCYGVSSPAQRARGHVQRLVRTQPQHRPFQQARLRP